MLSLKKIYLKVVSLCFSKTRDMVNPMNLETNIQTTKINHISIFNYHENTTYGFVENKLTTLIIDSTVQFLLLYIHPVLFVIFTILLAIKNTIMPIQNPRILSGFRKKKYSSGVLRHEQKLVNYCTFVTIVYGKYIEEIIFIISL